jgi:hypothetical protein
MRVQTYVWPVILAVFGARHPVPDNETVHGAPVVVWQGGRRPLMMRLATVNHRNSRHPFVRHEEIESQQ